MFLFGSWELLIGAGSKRLIGVARCLGAGGLQLTGSRWRGFRWDLARCPLGAASRHIAFRR